MSDAIETKIQALKEVWSKIERVDPCSEKILKMRDLLAKMDLVHLQRIVDAKINFLSIMAKTEIRVRKEKEAK